MIQVFKPKMIVSEIMEGIKPILEKGWIGMGGVTELFENEFSEYIGCKHSVAVNSCTSALHLALIIAGVEEGDEVITTPMTFVSTNHAILYQKAKPVFCDVRESTLHIDENKITANITKKTKAIMLVHYGGYVHPRYEMIKQIAKKHDIWLIEDCAHAAGSLYKKSEKAGNCLDYDKNLACFSFHAVKNLPTPDSGMITTNSKDVSERLRKLRWMGINKDTFVRTKTAENKGYNWLYNVSELGYKYHTNDIISCIGLIQLKYLDQHNNHRKVITRKYREYIDLEKEHIINFVPVGDSLIEESSCHMCVLRVKNRDEMINKLNKKDIYVGVHYYPNHLYPVYNNTLLKLEVVERVFSEIITLPLHLDVGFGEAQYVSEIINEG